MAWHQVENFRHHLKKYQEETGKTQAEVAQDLETTYGTLRFWLSGTRPPKVENLKRAASLFKCRVTEFIDDPGDPPPGITPEKWAEASERTRVLGSAMFEDLLQMPEDEQEEYYKLWLQGVRIGLARRAAEADTTYRSDIKTGGKGGKKP